VAIKAKEVRVSDLEFCIRSTTSTVSELQKLCLTDLTVAGMHKKQTVKAANNPSNFHLNATLVWMMSVIPALIVVGIFLNRPLTAWDAGGHVLASANFRDHIWPWLQGWNANTLLGYPQGYFYPSLFHWLAGGLAKLIPIESSVRLMLTLSTLALAFSFRSFARVLWPQSATQQLICVLLLWSIYLAPKSNIGGDLVGFLAIGLLAQQFALPLFFFYLSFCLSRQFKRWPWLESLTLAALFLSHIFLCIAAVVCSMCILASTIKSNWEHKTKYAKHYAVHGLIVIICCLAWLGPFLIFREYQLGASPKFTFRSFYGIVNDLGTANLICLVLVIAVCLFNSFRFSWATLSALLLAGIVAAAPLMSGERGSAPIHSYRFLTPLLFLIPALFEIKKKSLKHLGLVLACSFFIFASLRAIASLPQTSKAIEIGKEPSAYDRILIFQNRLVDAAHGQPHLLADSLGQQNHRCANGLFVESSISSPFVLSTLYSIGAGPFVWGIVPAPSRFDLANDQLAALGITHVLSTFELPELLTKSNRLIAHSQLKTDLFGLDAVQINNHIVEVAKSPKLTPRFTQTDVENWWIEPGLLQSPLIECGEQCTTQSSQDASLEDLRIEPGSYRFRINSQKPAWVIVKESYFPRWTAKSAGQKLQVHRAAPSVMAVFGQGEVQLTYERGWLEVLCNLVSAVAILACFTLAVRQRTKATS
jgi:hypothetical protein